MCVFLSVWTPCVCCEWWSGTVLCCISVISSDEWVQRERGGAGVCHPAMGLLVGGALRHPIQPLHPSAAVPSTPNLHPLALHFWVEKWELLHGGWLRLMPRNAPPSPLLSLSRSPALTALEVTDSNPSSDTPLSPLSNGIEHLASCRLWESNRLLHAWLRRRWMDPPFGLRR